MVDGGEGINVGMWFEDFGDRSRCAVADAAASVVGGKHGTHDVAFVGEVVRGFAYSGSGVYLEGEGKFDPSNSSITG